MIEALETRIAPAAIANLDLSSLNGANGFRINGAAANDRAGISVSGAGDFNGDGFDDLLIGSSPSSGGDGVSFLVFGKAGGVASDINLSMLDGTNGFRMSPMGSEAGRVVSAAGDVNGDGFGDLLIGSFLDAYVVFGRPGGFAANLDLSTLTSSNGFKISGGGGERIPTSVGHWVSAAGDINHDGFDDVLIGCANGMSFAGVSYVVFGKANSPSPNVNLSSLDGTSGFKISGVGANDGSGFAVSDAGDVNGDGFADLLIGAILGNFDTGRTGASYVVFGKASGFAPNLNLSTLDGTNGFKISGDSSNQRSGQSVSAAGDVNGDGFDDIIIGTAYGPVGVVIFGKASAFASHITPADLDGTNGLVLRSDGGDIPIRCVSDAGDVNGDGYDDLLVGVPESGANGATYVVFGKSFGFPKDLYVAALDGTNGFKMTGAAANDQSGISVSAAGDVNGDGFDDLLVGAYQADANGADSGASYVVFGFDTGAVTHPGTGSPDNLQGTSGSDVIIGGRGADALHGNGGGDVLRGAEGNDLLGISNLAFKRIQGGLGIDTLVLEGNVGLSFDLTTLANNRITGVEQIDLSGPGNHTLTLNAPEVLALSDHSNTLVVLRDQGDTVNIGSGWTAAPSEKIGSQTFAVYQQGAATLKVSTESVDLSKVNDAAESSLPTGGKFRVTQTVLSATDTVLTYSIGGSAIAGNDYRTLSGVVTIPAGQTTTDIDVTVFDDLVIEGSETVVLTLTGLTSGNPQIALGTIIGSINITDDDTATVTIAKIADGAETNTPVNGGFRVTQSLVSSTDTVINYSLGGTATSGSDFTALSGSVTILAGQTSADINVAVTNDDIVEATETLSITLTGFGAHDSDITLGTAATASLDIIDNDTASVTIGKIADGAETATPTSGKFRVTQSLVSSTDTIINYSVTGSATSSADFTQLGGTVTIPAGQTNADIELAVLNDALVEGTETVNVTLTGFGAHDSDITLGIATAASLDITDNDTATITIGKIADGTETDTPTNGKFRVTQSLLSSTDTVVNYLVGGSATSGTDFTQLSGTVTIPAGQTSIDIELAPLNDAFVEETEAVSVMLTTFGAHDSDIMLAAPATASTNITDNDTATVTIARIADGAETNTPTSGGFRVTQSLVSSTDTVINYSLGGTAASGSDFTALSGSVTILAGATSADVNLAVTNDDVVEGTETLSVTLTGFETHDLDIDLGTITDASLEITDDDTATVSIAALIAGGETTPPRHGNFRVTQSLVSSTDTVINYFVSGSATPGDDFAALGGTVTIPAGQVRADIEVAVFNDAIVEAGETVSIALTGFVTHDTDIALGATIDALEITDNDTATVTIARIVNAAEADPSINGKFRVIQSAASSTDTIVNYSMGGVAISGSDYSALPGTVTIVAGQTTADIDVAVINDGLVELIETVSLTLTGFGAHDADITFGTATSANIEIVDNDTTMPTVTLHGKRRATFTDVDGDLVTIKLSKGKLKQEDFTLSTSGQGAQLAMVDFRGESQFAGTTLSITAKHGPAASGDRLVNVGYINAMGVDLGAVVVKGDLGQIDAGNDADPRAGLLRLTAGSLGSSGLLTQLAGGSLQSDIVGTLKSLKLAHGLQDATLSVSGNIGALTIKGDMLGGSIRSDGNISAIKITGDLAASADSAATISARGNLPQKLAIASLSIGGSVDHAQIFAGYDRTGSAVNADASIGEVIVGLNWTASNLVAGASAGTDGMFGTDDDAPTSRDTPIVAKIASILIKGAVTGTNGGTDHFGFVAEQIAAFNAAGAKLTLVTGPRNDLAGLAVGLSGDIKVHEVK